MKRFCFFCGVVFLVMILSLSTGLGVASADLLHWTGWDQFVTGVCPAFMAVMHLYGSNDTPNSTYVEYTQLYVYVNGSYSVEKGWAATEGVGQEDSVCVLFGLQPGQTGWRTVYWFKTYQKPIGTLFTASLYLTCGAAELFGGGWDIVGPRGSTTWSSYPLRRC